MKTKLYGFFMAFLIILTSLTSFTGTNHRTYSTGVYLWSKGLKKYSAKEIINFINTHTVSTVAIPFKSYFNNDKTRQLAEQLKSCNVKVELIISNPEYIFPDKWDRFKQKLIKIFKNGFDAHLDIEPHLLMGYRNNRNRYLELFIELLRKSYNIAKEFGKNISVDINPFIFSNHIDKITKITKNSDNVVLMIYSTKNINKIKTLVKLYQKTKCNNKKIYIALRASDFKSLKDLKSFISTLLKRTNLKHFFIQNFRDLVSISD